MFREGAPFWRALARSLLYYRPALLRAYMKERALVSAEKKLKTRSPPRIREA
jgi:hypothetical protein